VAKVAAERRKHPGMRIKSLYLGPSWQLSYYEGSKERAQVFVHGDTGEVLEAWTGIQVAWKMARGYKGDFGRKVNAPYVWLPFCLLFFAPFFDPRRPFRVLHLDLLALLAFGASHFFFNRGEIDTSVPLVYPVLLYLCARMLWAGFRPRDGRGALVPVVPVAWLLMGVLFLGSFKVALNVADSNVIDVGYAGVVGAQRIVDGKPLYSDHFSNEINQGDTYGPVNYLAYIPFEQALPWSGTWDDVPPAHGAAIAFDLLTMLGLFLLGMRWRAGPEGRRLGGVMAYAWAAYPYTLFVLSTNANDSLVAMLIVYALLVLGSAPARGAVIALAAATKFAPFVLAPLFATFGGQRRLRSMLLFGVGLGATLALVVLPFVPGGGLRELYDHTLGFQAGRDSPFSIWGLHHGLGWLHVVVECLVVALALLVAVLPRRKSAVQVAALAAALIVAIQLVATHWFYLYVVWFAPLVLAVLFASHRALEPTREAAMESADPRPEERPSAEAALA
jgi:glycosyl transferase family 87